MMAFERSFDHAANVYDSVRPSYPMRCTVEIGIGTGKAAKPQQR